MTKKVNLKDYFILVIDIISFNPRFFSGTPYISTWNQNGSFNTKIEFEKYIISNLYLDNLPT